MLFTPFPRPKYRTYVTVGIVIGASIAFILNVFQPFGTDSFTHPYKHLILSGYGIVSMLTVAVYFLISLRFVSPRLENRWNILFEAIDFFFCLILSMTACYLYLIWVFDSRFRLQGLLEFLTFALAVSVLPTLAVLGFLYVQFRGVVRSQIILDHDRVSGNAITLVGSNKTDRVETSTNHINYIKAEDNYVIIHLTIDDADQRHMIRSTLKQMYQQLSDEVFYQCHRSYIVNTDKISGLTGNKNGAKIILTKDNLTVPLSRSNYDHVKNMIV